MLKKLLSFMLSFSPMIFHVPLYAQSFAPRIAIVDFFSDAQTDKQKEDVLAMRTMLNRYMIGLQKFSVLTNSEVDEFMTFSRIPIQDVYKEEYYSLFADDNIAYVISANVSALKKEYRVNYFFISTKSHQFFKSDTYTMKNDGRSIQTTMEKIVKEFFSTIPLDAAEYTSAYEDPKYAIGDTGPAGGIIFFVKGNYADGWRYLEAAPNDLTDGAALAKLPWGLKTDTGYFPDVPSTSTSLGKGKHNTELLAVDKSKFFVETPTAADICASLDFNGFRDWYLPSLDELSLLYKMLKQNNFGNFTDDAYWSSSQSTSGSAYYITFNNGRIYPNGLVTEKHLVRPIRSF